MARTDLRRGPGTPSVSGSSRAACVASSGDVVPACTCLAAFCEAIVAPRGAAILKLIVAVRRTALVVTLGSVVGCGAKATFSIAHQPRFTTCANGPPAARAGYPASFTPGMRAKAAGCAQIGHTFSLSDAMYRYDKVGGAGMNDIAIQQVSVVAVYSRTRNACGDTPIPVLFDVVEYFRLPANDMIATGICCEERFDGNYSGRVAIVDRTSLPQDIQNALPPIPAGANLAFLTIGTALSPAQQSTVRAITRSNASISWSQRYQYDGCVAPPNSATACGRRHCVELHWEDSNGTGHRSF